MVIIHTTRELYCTTPTVCLLILFPAEICSVCVQCDYFPNMRLAYVTSALCRFEGMSLVLK
jgi:hypothetical protein